MSNAAEVDGVVDDPTGRPSETPSGDVGTASDDQVTLAFVLRRYAIWLFLFGAYALAFLESQNLAVFLFRRQDVPVIFLTAAILLGLSYRSRLFGDLPGIRRISLAAALLISFSLLTTVSGTWLVFDGFDMSRDEFLANFDADVFARGRLIWPIPAEWRSYSESLMPLFMLSLPPSAGWISNYLPVHAMLRALAEQTIGRDLTSPILAVISAIALFRIARNLWPEAPRTAIVPLLLLALSPQYLVTAMTPFAMTAHLAFNLLWLLCFLQNNRRGDAGALACGFVATGLHQLIFHPMFAAPFIAELLLARRYRRASIFVLGYGAIAVFWILYPQMVALNAGVANPTSGSGGGIMALAVTVKALLGQFDLANILLMLLNLLRFAAWQHMLLLPLVLFAWSTIKRAEGIARPLLAGIVLTSLAALVLMPWQGNGWGYRYLHGLLGSFALLAGYGWQRLGRFAVERRAALMLTSGATVGLVLPFLLFSTAAVVAPYRAAVALIRSTPADIVLVDASGMLLGLDVVRNGVDPAQRPKVLDLRPLTQADLRHLCAGYDVRLFDWRHGRQAGMPLATTPDMSGARAILPTIGCDRPLPLSPTNAAAIAQ